MDEEGNQGNCFFKINPDGALSLVLRMEHSHELF